MESQLDLSQADIKLTDAETSELIERLTRVDESKSAIKSIAEATGRTEEEVVREIMLMRAEKAAPPMAAVAQHPTYAVTENQNLSPKRFVWLAIAGCILLLGLATMILTRPSLSPVLAPQPMRVESTEMKLGGPVEDRVVVQPPAEAPATTTIKG